jgi:pyrimidine 5'-nucleotidase
MVYETSPTTLFFDLDDTLYPAASGLWQAIRKRMTTYMVERLGFSAEEVDHIRHDYFTNYGTTLRGLLIHYPGRVNVDDYLAYVHDLPLPEFIQPDPALRPFLLSLPQSRWIFTNADEAHATRVMCLLGIEDCFNGIADIRALGFACKPVVGAYHRALELAGETDPRKCILLDDSPRNLAPARQMGFFTILVGTNNPDPAACLSIASLYELTEAIPGLVG